MVFDRLPIYASDFVREQTADIESQYELLSPAIGSGAYGEVRKAIHKASRLMRAIKIINKDQLNSEEQDLLINEVNILRELVLPSFDDI